LDLAAASAAAAAWAASAAPAVASADPPSPDPEADPASAEPDEDPLAPVPESDDPDASAVVVPVSVVEPASTTPAGGDPASAASPGSLLEESCAEGDATTMLV
jgi:hypothetical protein